jgi:oxygen-dependent protoporphyrinogen oxidase
VLEESDAAIQELAAAEMKDLLGISVAPDFCSIARWPRSMAQYTVGHAERIAAIQSRLKILPGLFLAGNGYQGIGIPDCVQMGRAAAKSAMSLG